MDLNFTSDLILENSRVRLEPLAQKHFEALLPIAIKHPNLLKYSPSKFGSSDALQAIFEKAFQQKKAETKYPFAIYDKEKKAYAGSTTYMNVSNFNQRLEIGSTWLGKEFQRTGLNRNCKFLLLKYAFETLEFERVELKTDDRNEQSKTAIQAIGAKYEGKLRSHTLMTDGYRRDTVYFSILKDEWQEVKSTIFEKMLKKNFFNQSERSIKKTVGR